MSSTLDHSELDSTFHFVSTPPILISVSPMHAFLSGSIEIQWRDERILSRSIASPLKICSHSHMGIPLGAPGESLMYNLADLMSWLNFRMRLADLAQLGFSGTVNSFFRLCQGMSLGCSFLRFLGLSSSDSEPEDDPSPSDPPFPGCWSLSVSSFDSLSRADLGSFEACWSLLERSASVSAVSISVNAIDPALFSPHVILGMCRKPWYFFKRTFHVTTCWLSSKRQISTNCSLTHAVVGYLVYTR